ncbi:MAG: ribonuclease HII [Candidatus Hodarchaeales archaeon]
MVLGIDEAGRGSVLGSMFIAGFLVNSVVEPELVELGVRDSKQFTSGKQKNDRAIIAKKLTSLGQGFVHEVLPREIDKSLENKADNLNLLELRHFASIIAEAAKNPGLHAVFIDAISKPEYTKKGIIKALRTISSFNNLQVLHENGATEGIKVNGRKIFLVAENKADSKYPVVASASIIAKNEREESLRRLEKKYGLKEYSLGAGYPNKNDLKMMEFLKSVLQESPPKQYHFFRYTWKWKNPIWQDIVAKYSVISRKQDPLLDYFKG